jgi:hypothetical protein
MLHLSKGKSLFKVKRLMVLGLLALVLGTSLALSTGVASAHPTAPKLAAASCYNTSCDGQSPLRTGCVNDARDIYSATSGDLGGGLYETVILRFSSTCAAAWAKVSFNKSLPSGSYGNAIITRNTDNAQVDCTYGDDIVYPGQTSCFSGMVGDYGSITSWAAGMYRTGKTAWHQVAGTSSY